MLRKAIEPQVVKVEDRSLLAILAILARRNGGKIEVSHDEMLDLQEAKVEVVIQRDPYRDCHFVRVSYPNEVY
jgi:hypothetical protein